MIHHFLINPAAGKGTLVEALKQKITRVCNARGVDYRIHTTTRRGDATDYVRAAVEQTAELQRFYACGGDGTLCETVNGAPLCDRAEFAVIPIGTGNDFEKNFSAPENFFNIEHQLDGVPTKLDMIRYNDRYALNMLNIGFDCNVAKKTGEIKRSPLIPSGLAYVAGVAVNFCKPFGTRIKVTMADGQEINESLMLVAVAGGCYYGGGFKAAPRASLTDGLLDLCIIKKLSRAKFLGLIGSYKNGTHLEQEKAKPYISYYQTPSISFRFDTPTNICVDGEIEMTDRVDIVAVPAACSFSIPQGSSLIATKKEAFSIS
jgi:YegS/Rv2252/BmrU family lipid kinase